MSGVYYPVDVLPGWMERISAISPATYALDGVRRAILDGDGLASMGRDLALLTVIGPVCIPVGHGTVLRRRAVREAQRQAQALRLIRPVLTPAAASAG